MPLNSLVGLQKPHQLGGQPFVGLQMLHRLGGQPLVGLQMPQHLGGQPLVGLRKLRRLDGLPLVGLQANRAGVKETIKGHRLDTAMRAGVIAEGGGNFFDPFFWPRFCPSENISKNHQNFYPQVFAQIKNIRNFAPTMTRKKDRFF